MNGHQVVAVDRVEIALIDAAWPFAQEHAAAIERNWQARTAATPEIFDGRVMLLHDGALERYPNGRPVFRGHCFEIGFKAFLAWRDFGFPAAGVRNCFAMAALESADGAFLLGEMNVHTAPAGQVYFPSGTPDRKDLVGTTLDLESSARRELEEETGLTSDAVAFGHGFTLVMNDTRLCCMKPVRSPEPADALVDRIHAWLARDPKPELARMHVVRSRADFTPAMPGFVVAYLEARLDLSIQGDGVKQRLQRSSS